ncbi:hypothetical protein KIN20_020572 [Parelaphostrongylus tenuis]|uniref:Uncharacterized protein n=1 Tax=Parelaphostrongylus tenuis TaxID=148309 RepID=A0AAD5MMU0_PARTN|nr:hypothetical protein KIN20_020572 [Parelaphostrongylus tenuis]
MDSSIELCKANGEPSSIDWEYHRTSNIMDFYRAERLRVLSMRRQSIAAESVASLDSRLNVPMDDKMEIVNDENIPLERCKIPEVTRTGCKRIAQSMPPLLISNRKRAKFS